MVYDLVHNGKVYFLSRPRRFGKSLLLSTLESYFKGRKELFKGLAIDELETEWNEYPVLHLDFNNNKFEDPGVLEQTIEDFVAQAEKEYGKGEFVNSIGDRFRAAIANAHKKTGKRVVVLVDEYDKPLLDVMGLQGHTISPAGEKITVEESNRRVLKSFYSTFKSADADLQFVFLTGVTKFSQVSVFSGFNQPRDISMDGRYDAICGITKDELFEKLDTQIAEMAVQNEVSAEEMKQILKLRYDGYHFSSRMTDLFNPFSILNAFSSMELDDYWFRTASPTYLVRLMSQNNVTIDEFIGKWMPASAFMDFKADNQTPLPMLYQSGYLTIKDYKRSMMRPVYKLDFPNDEVKAGFVPLIAANYFKKNNETDIWIEEVADAMETGEMEKIEKLFISFFAGIPYSLREKGTEGEKEKHFQYTMFLVLNMISTFHVSAEKQQSEGRVDCIAETPKHVYIFEFKRDGSAEDALKQIEDKGYARPYAADKRTIHKIGVNFSSQTGTIDGWRSK